MACSIPKACPARILAVAYGAVASLPPALRVQAGVQYAAGSLPRLTDAMSVWSRGSDLPANEFAERFLGRTADDPVAQNLRSAAVAVAQATDHATLGEAASNVAGAMQAVGIDRWPRFLAEAHDRTLDAATLAAIARPSPATADQIAAVPRRLSAILGNVGTPVGAPAASRPPPAPPGNVDHEPNDEPKDEQQDEHHREHPAAHAEAPGHKHDGEAHPPGHPPPGAQDPLEDDASLPGTAAADEPSEAAETSQSGSPSRRRAEAAAGRPAGQQKRQLPGPPTAPVSPQAQHLMPARAKPTASGLQPKPYRFPIGLDFPPWSCRMAAFTHRKHKINNPGGETP